MVREKVSLLKYTQPFHLQLIKSSDAELMIQRAKLYWATLYKGLGHSWTLVSSGVLELIPWIPRKYCIYFLAFPVILLAEKFKLNLRGAKP